MKVYMSVKVNSLNKGTPDEIAIQVSRNSRKGVDRCLEYAFEYTKRRNKREHTYFSGKDQMF